MMRDKNDLITLSNEKASLSQQLQNQVQLVPHWQCLRTTEVRLNFTHGMFQHLIFHCHFGSNQHAMLTNWLLSMMSSYKIKSVFHQENYSALAKIRKNLFFFHK